MNQTNFGFNPARQTIVSSTPQNQTTIGGVGGSNTRGDMIQIESMTMGGERRALNTQKRNRTQTIQIESPVNGAINMHQRGGSLNINELYQHYHSKAKASSRVPGRNINGINNGPIVHLQNNLIGPQGVTQGSINGETLN